MANTLNFQPIGLVTYFQDPWVLNNASIVDNVLTILPNGTAELSLTEGINEDFKYLKCEVIFKSIGITDSNNYKTNPSLYIKEVYKDQNNDPYRAKTRGLCFNNNIKVADEYIKDETILETLNKPLYSLYIYITNNTEETLYIKSINLFKSIDISESQVQKTVESVTKQGSMTQVNINHNDDINKTLNGLEFQLENGRILKFKPVYYNGQIISISTNVQQTISCLHFIRDTDLES